MTELHHYGIKGMKWGVRRYQNKDGTLTAAGKKKYRRDYDEVRLQQVMAERTKTVNAVATPSNRLNSYINSSNAAIYNDRARAKLSMLFTKIGDKGISQIEDDIKSEGRTIANKIKRETELFNQSIDMTIDDNYLWYRDPQKEYDKAYSKYLKNNLVIR